MLTPRRNLRQSALVNGLSVVDGLARDADAPYVQIWDLRSVGMLGALERELVLELCREHREDGLLAGCVIIPGEAFADDFTTEMFWPDPPDHPVAVFERMGEAMSWASTTLEDRGGSPVPVQIRSMQTQELPVLDEEPAPPDSIERTPNPGDIILRSVGSGRSVAGFAALMKLRWSERRSWIAPEGEDNPEPVTWTGPFATEAEAEAVRAELEDAGLFLIVDSWPE